MKSPKFERRVNVPGQQPQAASGGGGFPWGKVAIGCGCLTLLAIVVMGVGGYFLWRKGSEIAKKSGVKDIVQAAKEAQDDSASGGSGDDADIKAEARKRKQEALDAKKIREYVRKPLTRKDVDAYFDFVHKWQNNPAYKNWVVEFKKMKDLDKKNDDSVTGQLQAVGQTAKWMSAADKVMKAFDKQVRDSGGYQQYYGRVIRVGGVVAAADRITKTNKKLKDANADAVADEMLTERPKIAKQYAKNMKQAKEALAEAKKAQKAGKQPDPSNMAALGGLMSVFQGPGTIALARMPEQSFQTWKSLSPKERKRLRDSLTDSIAPGPWFGLFAVNPAALVMSSYMAEMDTLKGE